MSAPKPNLPCPYCGGAPSIFQVSYARRGLPPGQPVKAFGYFIECTNCKGRGPEAKTAARAWERWNSRVTWDAA